MRNSHPTPLSFEFPARPPENGECVRNSKLKTKNSKLNREGGRHS